MLFRSAQVLSAQRVAFAGSGVDPSSPTALDVAAQAARIGELNALRRQFEFQEEARAIREAGSRAVMLGISEGIGTVLEGGYKMREYGVGSKQKTGRVVDTIKLGRPQRLSASAIDWTKVG